MMRIGIYGAGGFGRDVMPLARNMFSDVNKLVHFDFVDDSQMYEYLNGNSVFRYSDWLGLESTSRFVSVAIANGYHRRKIAERCLDDGINFIEVRAKNVVELDEVIIGPGAILCPFVVLGSNIKIGKFFHANLFSYVEHDCIIGDYVTFAPGVKCNGNVHIEDDVYVGSGAIIKQGNLNEPLHIGRGSVIGMGAVVTKNVPAGSVVVGNPAKQIDKLLTC